MNTAGIVAFVLVVTPFCPASSEDYQPIKVDVKELQARGITKVFSFKELAQYNGKDSSKPIFVSVKGVVFDVTPSAHLYGEGGGYHALAGKDISRAMGTQNLWPEEFTHDLTGMLQSELAELDQMFNSVFLYKYNIAGLMEYLVKEQLGDKKTEL